MTSEHLVNTTQIEEFVNSTPGSRTLTSSILVDGNVYKFLCNIQGGYAPPTDRVYVGGAYTLYQDASAFPCGQPECGTIQDLLALDQTAEIVDLFKTQSGFWFFGMLNEPIIYDLQKVGNYIAVGWNGNDTAQGAPGSQSQYSGSGTSVPVTNGIVLLNTDGTVNTSFNTTKGSSTVHTIASTSTHVYVAGNFWLWNQGTIGGANNTIGTSIAKLNLSNGTFDTSLLWQWSNPGSDSFVRINRMKINGNKIYIGGNFTYTQGGQTWYSMLRLNMDGTVDTTWSNKGAAWLVGPRPPMVWDFEFYGNSVYVVGNFTNWNSTSTQGGGSITSPGIVKLSVADGSPQTFNVGTGFGTAQTDICRSAAVDSTGIYIGGAFTTYNGVDVPNYLIKLNHDATVNTTFSVQTLNDTVNDVKLSPDGFLYVGGWFTTYGTTTSKELVKLDATTGNLVTQFAVGEGFEENTNPFYDTLAARVNVILIPEGTIPPPTVYPYTLCYNDESPCVAYCCTNSSSNVWGNASTLTTSTILYSNSGATAFATPGYYSDGASIAQVGLNGVITSFINPSSCNCSTTVKAFNVVYDADSLCDACCGIPNTNVYSNASTWSGTTILYADQTATTFATSGYYNFAGVVLVIGSNGVVTVVEICDCECPTQACYEWIISNNSGTNQATYSYTDCNGTPRFGNLPPLTATMTTCTTYGSLSVTGDVSITQSASCADEINVVSVFGYMEPCIGGTIDDHMGVQVNLSAPVTVDTTFDVEVRYVFPGNTCSGFYNSQFFQVDILAGENSSNFNACYGGAYFPTGVSICSACIQGVYGNNVDVINLGNAAC